MVAVLIYGVTLAVASLISARAQRSPLSTAVLFLLVGIACGPVGLGVLTIDPHDDAVSGLVELALVVVLFVDGTHAPVDELRERWSLTVRAIGIGLPLTFVLITVAALAAGLALGPALLLAAVLSPTDPLLSAAILGQEAVPRRLRSLLNAESGLNDGLALPLVLLAVAVAGGPETTVTATLLEILEGIGLGIGVALLLALLLRVPHLGVSERYLTLAPVAVLLVVFAAAGLVGANPLLASFAAGVTVASTNGALVEAFRELDSAGTELLKLAVVLVFGTLLTSAVLATVGWPGAVLAVAVLFLVRPIAVAVALLGTKLSRRERLVAGWFGPRGFASVLYALYVLNAGVAGGRHVFALAVVTVAASVFLHSSTDVLVARSFAVLDDASDGEASNDARSPGSDVVFAPRLGRTVLRRESVGGVDE